VTALKFETVFRGSPPPRDGPYLLDQAVTFVKGRWLDYLPDRSCWPAELDERTTVDRRVLFTIGERADDALGAARLLVATFVWATGTKWRNAERLGRVFDENRDVVGPHLAAAVTVAREDAVAGFAMLTRKGAHALSRLGGAEFTRVLHFGAFDGTGPLILDQNVTVGINALRGSDWSPDGPWSAEQYGDYLTYAADWADQWESGTSPDLVERTLSAAGQALGRVTR